MKALVLSGGGNRGPLELGAVRVLLESGFQPDMIVGTSAGAINGAFLAIDPTPAQAELGAALWRDAGTRKLFSTSRSSAVMRLLRGSDYLADNAKLLAYMRAAIPAHARTFGGLKLPFYVVITHLASQQMYYFGDDPAADVAEAIILSAAVPGFFPPHLHNGQKFTDGGTASNIPVALALAKGATEIYALDLAFQPNLAQQPAGALSISSYCGSYLLYGKMLREIESACRVPGVQIHHIPIHAFQNVALGDFSQVDEMIRAGAAVMSAYLEQPEPNIVRYPTVIGPEFLPDAPPGARPFSVDLALAEITARAQAAQTHGHGPADSPEQPGVHTHRMQV
jgi:NTE family protein